MLKVELLHIGPPIRPQALAAVSVRLVFETNSTNTITVSDLRVLRDQATGELWVGFPMFRTPNGQILQSFFATRQIKRAIEDCVIPAFERWQSEGGAR